MPNYLKEYGPKLIEHGYLPVPIAPGNKGCFEKGWTSMRMTAEDCDKYPAHGVGLLCGQGDYPLMGVDVDSKNDVIVNKMKEVIGAIAFDCLERVGNAPKTLFLFRAEEAGWGKATSSFFADPEAIEAALGADNPKEAMKKVLKHRLELLGSGTQFVAYHIHPGTQKPYEWSFVGDPATLPAKELPVMTKETALSLISTFTGICLESGLVVVPGSVASGTVLSLNDADNPFAGYGSRLSDYTLEEAELDMSVLSSEERDVWLAVGMALHFQFDGSDEAYEKWDEWSAPSSTYAGSDDTRKTWASFGKSYQGRKKGCATLKWLAKQERVRRQIEVNRAALEEALKEVEACTEYLALLPIVAKSVGKLVSGDVASEAIVADAIQKRFKALSGKSLALSKVKEAMLCVKKVSDYDRTESGNTQRLVDRYGNKLLWYPDEKSWYLYEDGHWQTRPKEFIVQLAQNIVKDLSIEAAKIDDAEARQGLLKFATASQTRNMVIHMEELARSHPVLLQTNPGFDEDMNLLCFKNGTYNIRERRLMNHSPSFRLTKQFAYDYDPQAQCPTFRQAVLDCFKGSVEMAEYFKRAMGYTLLGDPREQVFFLLHGGGANGKSTLVSTITDVVGMYAKTAAPETVTSFGKQSSRAGGAREDLVRLKDARLVCVSETADGASLTASVIKAMTGGDRINVRDLYKGSIEYAAKYVIVLCTNHKPNVDGFDFAVQRRIQFVPFLRNFRTDPTIKEDKNLRAKLMAEGEGVLMWLIEGLNDYLDMGLKPPKEVVAACEGFQKENDIVARFIEDCCDTGADKKVSVDDFYSTLTQYAANEEGSSILVPSKKALASIMESKGFERKRGGKGMLYLGLSVKDDMSSHFPSL